MRVHMKILYDCCYIVQKFIQFEVISIELREMHNFWGEEVSFIRAWYIVTHICTCVCSFFERSCVVSRVLKIWLSVDYSIFLSWWFFFSFRLPTWERKPATSMALLTRGLEGLGQAAPPPLSTESTCWFDQCRCCKFRRLMHANLWKYAD